MRLGGSGAVTAAVRRTVVCAGNRFVHRVGNGGLVTGPTDHAVDSIQTVLTLEKAKVAVLEGKRVDVGFDELERSACVAYAQRSGYLRRPRRLRETPR